MAKNSGSAWAGVLVMGVMFAALELLAMLAFKSGKIVRTGPPLVTYPYHSYLGWENRPNYEYTGILAEGLHHWAIRTDSSGRSITPHSDVPDPDLRVVMVGGSAVFGVGQTGNAHTVPAQVELELERRTGLRVEVINLAVGGYTSFQEMLNVERYLADHEADVVVSLSGYNDAFAAAIERSPEYGLLLHRLDPKTELVRSIERGDLGLLPTAAGLLVQGLRRRSNAIDLLGKVADRVRPAAKAPPVWGDMPMPDSAEIVRRARFVLTNYAMMDGMARQHGARFFMFLQPTAMNRRTLTDAERQALDRLDKSFMDRARPVVRIFYPAVIAAGKRFAFHDITGCLDEFAEPAYADECHYLDAATPTVAAAVCDVIAPAAAEIAASRRVPARVAAPPALR